MGVMRRVTWVFGIFLSIALFNPCFAENGVSLVEKPWPDIGSCQDCICVQFGRLEMRIPLSVAGKVLVTDHGDSVLHIFQENDGKKAVHFLSVSRDRLMGMYESAGLLKGLDIGSNEDLFDALGRLSAGNEALAAMRRIESIDVADGYIKASKGAIHSYWIKSSLSGGAQRIYFVMDDDDTVYMLAGDVSKELYEAVLANMRIADIP